MLQIGRPWRYANEGDAIHFMVSDDGDNRRIKLKRSENAALYDFLSSHTQPREPEPTEPN